MVISLSTDLFSFAEYPARTGCGDEGEENPSVVPQGGTKEGWLRKNSALIPLRRHSFGASATRGLPRGASLLPKASGNRTLVQNIIIYDELKKILSSFNSAGIRVIVLAGAAIAERLYPDISERFMSDIDLLVKPTDLPEIEQQLAQLGYCLDIGRREEAHYHNPGSKFPISIDIHNRLTHLTEKGLADAWSRAVKTTINGVDALVLSPEDALIYTAGDAAIHHAWLREVWLKDMTMLINKYDKDIDWSLVIKIIRENRLAVPLYYTFIVANQRVKAGIPDWVIKAIKPGPGEWLASWLYRIALCRSKPIDEIAPILRFVTRSGRARVFFDSFFPSTDFMRRRYELQTQRLAYLYYLPRAMSNLWRVIKVVIKTGVQTISRN